MLYYEITIETNEKVIGKIAEKCSAESVKDDKQKAILTKLNAEAKCRFGDNKNKVLYFSDFDEKKITAVVGYKYECLSDIYDDILFMFKRYAEQKYNIKFNEITVEYFESSLNQISDMGYARIGLYNLNRRLKLDYRNNITFSATQTIVPENKLSYNDAVVKANEIMASGDFADELKRIYSDKHPKEFFGHPVHYKISADEVQSAWEQAKLLVRCLYSNGRLKSRRIDRVNKVTDSCYDEDDMFNLFYNAEGGVLFIDEAYSLVDNSGSFADEAINTIVQEMENHRDDVIVIFAGYPDKMKAFVEKNEGLKSRIAFHIDFPDYNTGELLDIMKLMMKDSEYTMTTEAEMTAMKIFETAQHTENFGNGRFVRNVLEQAEMRQSKRLMEQGFCDTEDKETLFRLEKDDFSFSALIPKEERKRRIGFTS